jgi:hypothetical protein
MAYILKNIGNVPNTPFYTFECDNSSDISQIPTEGISMGSRCYVINEGKEFALNSAGEWKSVPHSSSGGSDSPEIETIIYDGGSEDE